MDFWTPQHFQQMTQGRWLVEPTDRSVKLAGISIDSRTLKRGQVFVAIKGERFDGHDYLGLAVAGGAAMTIVEHEPATEKTPPDPSSSSPPCLLVDDTIKALQDLARHYRNVLRYGGVKVIAVTGSNGKTTTRHIVHTLLSAKLKGSQSPKSFNNHLGVPLTMLGASHDDNFVVAEVGTNHPGEIATLADILRPDVAVITNIGTAHIGNFGSRGAIAREKKSLFEFVEPGGLAVVPEGLEAQVPQYVSFQCARADEPLAALLPLPGRHNLQNAALAVQVARWFGLDDNSIAGALATVQPLPGRLEPIHLGQGVHVLNDTYNANPDSVAAALDQLSATTHPRRVAILGDMLELGDDAPQQHRQIADQLDGLRCDENVNGHGQYLAIFIGPLAKLAAQALAERWPGEQVHAYDAWSDDLPGKIAALLQPGDLVLIKASRAMALERLIPAIENKFAVETRH